MASTKASPDSFSGFPAALITYFDELEENNTRGWFTENRHRYDAYVRGPMDAFLASVAAEFGAGHVFRPNRDTRFSNDKTPYKTNIGAIVERNGVVFYVHLDGGGLMAASGYYQMAADQIQRFRAAVADDESGPALEKIVADATATGLVLHDAALKRVPSPFGQDHPRGELLRRKSMTLSKQFGTPAWMKTKAARDRIVELWWATAPLNAWLAANVGPTDLPQR